MRPLGYAWGAKIITCEMRNSNILTVEAKFVGDGKEEILSNYKQYFGPVRQGWG